MLRNIIRPLVAVNTNIGMDHVDYLDILIKVLPIIKQESLKMELIILQGKEKQNV